MYNINSHWYTTAVDKLIPFNTNQHAAITLTWTFSSCETNVAMVERDFLKLVSFCPSRLLTSFDTAMVDYGESNIIHRDDDITHIYA